MNRRGFLFRAALPLAFFAPRSVNARQASEQNADIPRVGYLGAGQHGPGADLRSLEDGLREHGFMPGTNVVIERRSAEGRLEQLADVATELVRLRASVIVAPSEQAAIAARRATDVIPIVMVLGIDPVRQGLIRSLARPGGNVTGLTVDPGPEIIAKRLELLREILPRARTIGLLTEPPAGGRLTPLEEAARSAGVSLIRREVRRSDDLEEVFASIKAAGATALLVSGATRLYLARHDVTRAALKHRLPAIYPLSVYVDAGGMISYGVDMLDLFRRAGGYVARILKGAKPDELPVEQPTKFELVINLKAARALGLTIPPSLLVRADKVIE